MGEAIITRRGGGKDPDALKMLLVEVVQATTGSITTKTVQVDGTIHGVLIKCGASYYDPITQFPAWNSYAEDYGYPYTGITGDGEHLLRYNASGDNAGRVAKSGNTVTFKINASNSYYYGWVQACIYYTPN